MADSDYSKLADNKDAYDLEYISKQLVKLNKLISGYEKSQVAKKNEILREIHSIQVDLRDIFSQKKVKLSEKQIFQHLQKQFEEINKNFGDIRSSIDVDIQRVSHASSSLPMSLEERQSLVFQNEEELNEAELKERREKIINLHHDMAEINGIFKDVASLVQEQGVMLDKAENNVDIAVKESGKAVNELGQGQEYQKSARKKMLIIFLIVFIVFGGVAIWLLKFVLKLF